MKPQHERRTQAERRAATRAAVLDSATRLFGEKGYAATPIDEIAAACGVTIRPIYHYFGGKQGLFEAVNERMEERIVSDLEHEAAPPGDAPALRRWGAFIELCADPAFRQIVLVDAPNVLGRDRWATSAVTKAALATLEDMQAVDERQRPLVARMLVGALGEAALAIAESDDPATMAREATVVVTRTLRALLDQEDPT